MIAVARLTAYKPKISTENAATDRKLFVCHFPLSFLREIWLLTYTVLTYMGRGNVARVSMRGRWIVHDDDEDEDHDHDHDHDDDEDEEAAARASVAVDDDPEETMGRETVGRKLGEAEKKTRGREEFRKNLPPFWKNLNRPCPSQRNFLRITVFILRAQRRAYGLGPFFLECWQMSLKFLRLVPIQLGRGEQVYSPTLSTRPNPTPQLTKTLEMSERMSKIIFFVCVTIVFFMETGSKLELYCEFFCPRFTDMTHNLCVSIAQKKIKIHTGKMPKWLIIYFAPLSIQKVKN